MTNPKNRSSLIDCNSTTLTCHENKSVSSFLFVPYHLEVWINVVLPYIFFCFWNNDIEGVPEKPMFANGRN
jgi:hypothetical protein